MIRRPPRPPIKMMQPIALDLANSVTLLCFFGSVRHRIYETASSEQRLRANAIDLKIYIYLEYVWPFAVCLGGYGSHGDKSSSVKKYEINNTVTRICSDCKV